MPSKKKKFNARFPPARIKKIMQTDEDVGKVAAAVPVIISKALEMFVQSLVERASEYTRARNAKTMTTSHLPCGLQHYLVVRKEASVCGFHTDFCLNVSRLVKQLCAKKQKHAIVFHCYANVPDLPSNEEERDGEPKPKRKRKPKAPVQNKERKKSDKRKPQTMTVSDESEELESEEEDSSSEGTSNHNSVTPPSIPSITLTRPSIEHNQECESSLVTMNAPRLSQMSGIMGNSLDEDDDYDS